MSPDSPSGIGSLNESSLHAQIKRWYAHPGDCLEREVEGYIVDIVRGDLLIEVQTSGFATIRDKLQVLLRQRRVRLVHPIPHHKWLVLLSPDGGEVLRRRRSPKRGCWLDLFDELIYIAELIRHPALAIEALLVDIEEYRCDDGRGSWRRKGVSIRDRRLLNVVACRHFMGPNDLLALLPTELPHPFTNRMLGERLHLGQRRAARITYTLEKVGVLQRVGKKGNALQFERAQDTQ